MIQILFCGIYKKKKGKDKNKYQILFNDLKLKLYFENDNPGVKEENNDTLFDIHDGNYIKYNNNNNKLKIIFE